ncbi:hypothetical protein ACFIOY_21395 [Bradyrhizobium sp. TZ2]
MKNGTTSSTKKPTVASATNSEDHDIEVPAGRLHFKNFREWLEKYGYLPADEPPPKSDIGTRELFLTIFEDKTGAQKFGAAHTLSEWQEYIRICNADSKDKLLWLDGGVFGEKLSVKGSFRTDENLLHLTAVVVEHDAGTVRFDAAMATVSQAGLRCLGYTSPSYRDENQRWRLIFPLSRDCLKSQHKVLVAIVNGLFGGKIETIHGCYRGPIISAASTTILNIVSRLSMGNFWTSPCPVHCSPAEYTKAVARKIPNNKPSKTMAPRPITATSTMTISTTTRLTANKSPQR